MNNNSPILNNQEVKFYCILKRKKNNFFITIMKSNGVEVLFSKSCGSLAGVRGSKKYTTVALESLRGFFKNV